MSDGWTKDSDKNTVTGETVAPLPFHGMKRYPYGADERFPDTPRLRAWKKEWNTRVMGAPLPRTRSAGPGAAAGPLASPPRTGS